jgi:hypothetical protein
MEMVKVYKGLETLFKKNINFYKLWYIRKKSLNFVL